MPWKESSPVTERMKFVSRLTDGEKMTDLCREFGISRKTGYKIWDRYRRVGLDGLKDQSRRPWSHPRKTPKEVVLIGIPPQNLDMHVGLSSTIEALMLQALEAGEQVINTWLGAPD